MLLSELNKHHPDYHPKTMSEARDLFEGGQRMRHNTKDHIIQNDQELWEIYNRRCRSAHYVNYCGPMGAYFASFVASQPVRFNKAEDSFWSDFATDCDGKKTDFNTFFTAQLIEALTTSRAFWRVQFPSPTGEVETLSDIKTQGIDRAILVSIPAEQIIDWERDDEGRYLWMRQLEIKQRRPGTGKPIVNELTWTQWNADGAAQRWRYTYEGDATMPPETADAEEIEPPYNPLKRSPIVALELPAALYLMGHLASPQLEIFRKRCALAWSIERTCYAMPVFKLKDARKPPKMGAGYYLVIGQNDDVVYPSPPSVAYGTIGDFVKELVQELHRVGQAMARGVDNNAAALGRSGESKQADDRATEIVVSAYANRLLEAAQCSCLLISEGPGDHALPEVGGYTGYNVLDPSAVIEQFLGIKEAQLHSVTAMREAEKMVTRAFLPNMSEEDRLKSNKEIDDGITPEELEAARNPVDMSVPPPEVPSDKALEGDQPTPPVGAKKK